MTAAVKEGTDGDVLLTEVLMLCDIVIASQPACVSPITAQWLALNSFH